jgi:D-glycero-alpha-D-manno-heptose-7-phosphate kinase
LWRVATNAGAKAGKVSGAGGGGFMMFFVDPIDRSAVTRALDGRDGQVMSCTFTDIGAQSWRVS